MESYETWIWVGLAVLLVAAALILYTRYHTAGNEHFGMEDQNYALASLEILNADLHHGKVIDVGDRFLERFDGVIILAVTPKEKDATSDEKKLGKENFVFFNPVNTRYWPYYFYSYPYQYKEGGAWPPGMFSRLYNWQPGYDTAGWSYWLRPGMAYTRWPRNRWVKSNGSYFYIDNGTQEDRPEDYNKSV